MARFTITLCAAMITGLLLIAAFDYGMNRTLCANYSHYTVTELQSMALTVTECKKYK